MVNIKLNIRARHMPLPDGPRQPKLSVEPVNLITFFFLNSIICLKKCQIVWAGQVKIYRYVKPWIYHGETSMGCVPGTGIKVPQKLLINSVHTYGPPGAVRSRGNHGCLDTGPYSSDGIVGDHPCNICYWESFTYHNEKSVNSTHLPSGAAYMRQWTESSLVQVMACRLFGAKPLPEPMLVCCQLVSWE